ncbi:MAG: OadG family protein [Fastidiosipilaceae bacterium]|jgi:sodium pump decarboxylase gamma subunit|nr:OadG family protein [Clostridiaceae bacterium]
MENFTISNGVGISLFSMLVVFLILVILAVIISLLRYLPKSKEEPKIKTPMAAPTTGDQASLASTSDEEERMVAMLVASCVAKGTYAKDVKIISVERVK